MGRPRIVHCRTCGRHIDECGPLSRARNCADCFTSKSEANAYGLANHTGDALLRWRKSVAASIGATLNEEISKHDSH